MPGNRETIKKCVRKRQNKRPKNNTRVIDISTKIIRDVIEILSQ